MDEKSQGHTDEHRRRRENRETNRCHEHAREHAPPLKPFASLRPRLRRVEFLTLDARAELLVVAVLVSVMDND